eukprot:993424-Heterocapsa_arctica.AAC.1
MACTRGAGHAGLEAPCPPPGAGLAPCPAPGLQLPARPPVPGLQLHAAMPEAQLLAAPAAAPGHPVRRTVWSDG